MKYTMSLQNDLGISNLNNQSGTTIYNAHQNASIYPKEQKDIKESKLPMQAGAARQRSWKYCRGI
jgi:hypothetical protein